MSNIRSSLAYSIASSYLAIPLQLLGTMIVSRLLTPAETGVFAVATVFSAFASTFRDFGVAEYLIQEKELTDDCIRAALTVNIAISWLMGLLLYCAAPFAADFYATPGIAEVMHVQAFNFLLIPFGAVTMANFRRALDFRPIFIAGMLANITTFTVSTLCAYHGLAYMSLAWASFSGVAVTVATSLWFRPADFPRWPGVRGIGRVIHFGKFASGIYIVGQLGRGAPEMIIGRAQGMVSVAFFSRASGLIELFNRNVLNAILPVCLPYFAKNNREHGNVTRGYLLAVSIITAIGWPFLAGVAIGAYAAVRIVYGPQWIASVPLAQILCAAGALEMVHYLAKEALIATGEIKRSNLLQLGLQTARVCGILVVIPFGVVGACWGLFVAALFNAVFAQWNLGRCIGLRARDVARCCLPSLAITAVTIAPLALWAAIEGVGEANYVRTAVLGGAVSALLWLAALRAFSHPLWSEITATTNKLARRLRRHD